MMDEVEGIAINLIKITTFPPSRYKRQNKRFFAS